MTTGALASSPLTGSCSLSGYGGGSDGTRPTAPRERPVTEHPPPRVEHTADGTLIHDTAKGDSEVRAALDAAGGFRWSRTLDAWYLPRTWRKPTRTLRVRTFLRVMREAGREVLVEDDERVDATARERADVATGRAEVRAERMDERAERLTAESRAAGATFDGIMGAIPPGQPILVGHHSEGRHRRDLARAERALGRTVEAAQEAERAALSARRAEVRARGELHSVPGLTVRRRIDRLEADLRKCERERSRRVDVVRDDLAYNRELLAAQIEAGLTLAFRREDLLGPDGNLRPGTEVQISGRWVLVERANKASITARLYHAAWTDTAPYADVTSVRMATGVQPREEATA